MSICLVYIITPNLQEAKDIGKHLVEKNLAACINIIPGMTSLYRWEGKIEEATEFILLAKTNQENSQALIEEVVSKHSYDVPCAISIPIQTGNPAYMSWLEDQLK